MADINTEVVGGPQKTQQEKQKKHKLDFKEFKFKTSLDDAFYARAHFEEFFRRTGTQLVVLLAVAVIAQALITNAFFNPEISLYQKIGIVLVGLMTFVAMPLLAKKRWPYMKKSNDFWLPEQRCVLNLKGFPLAVAMATVACSGGNCAKFLKPMKRLCLWFTDFIWWLCRLAISQRRKSSKYGILFCIAPEICVLKPS